MTTTTQSPTLTRLDIPKFKILGSYQAKQYGLQWVVIWLPTLSPSGLCSPRIIANCASETQAKAIKRALQNSLNHQARKAK